MFAPLVAFQFPVLPWEKKLFLKVLIALLPGFLSCALLWGVFASVWTRQLGNSCSDCFSVWAWGRDHGNSDSWRGLQAAVFGLVFVLLFLFNWLRKANTLRSFVSVWGVCAWESEHPQSGPPVCKWSILPNTGDFWSKGDCWFYCWLY